MDQHYDHPILLMQHMVWHEGYHHGQIKLALKLAGLSVRRRGDRPGDLGRLAEEDVHALNGRARTLSLTN